MLQLVLLRHGESEWNLANRFTGWTDVDLSEKGVQEAHQGATLLKKEGFSFDIAYTSVLKRAIRTLWIVLDDMDLMWIPVRRAAGTVQAEDRRGVRLRASTCLEEKLRHPPTSPVRDRQAPSAL